MNLDGLLNAQTPLEFFLLVLFLLHELLVKLHLDEQVVVEIEGQAILNRYEGLKLDIRLEVVCFLERERCVLLFGVFKQVIFALHFRVDNSLQIDGLGPAQLNELHVLQIVLVFCLLEHVVGLEAEPQHVGDLIEGDAQSLAVINGQNLVVLVV
jgi:hypothetical protein